jgi:hypothetical protein
MAKIWITTQIQENYGAHDWDGVGECPQYWKFKGGNDYMVPLEGFRSDGDFAEKKLRMIVDSVRLRIDCETYGYREYVVGWEVVDDDFITVFEKSQLECEGVITYAARVIELEELV